MSDGRALAPRPEAAGRLWPLLLVPVALLCDLGAALPLRSYYFRDFTVAFAPLRVFAARELREGRIPWWNPYVFEGSFQLPDFYPPDLLHALAPTPAFVSWLLSLHLPLAALSAYWLARELGASRAAGFVCGVVFSLGGFTLSCLNLYVFLQALALAPFVAGLLRRAALRGGGATLAAAVAVALATATLAVEFVAQAVLLGLALALAEAGRRAVGRLALAVALGAGLAAVPVAVVLGMLPETARGAGFPADVTLANAVHPAVLLQALLPRLFGDPALPAAWWGGRFFSKGLPYFLSLYLGPLVLSLAPLGLVGLGARVRAALLGPAALGLWYALGPYGGLATLARQLPLATAFRFPSKALLLPFLVIALLAGLALDRLREAPARLARLAAIAAAWAGLGLATAAALHAAPRAFVLWTGVVPSYWPTVVRVAWSDALVATLAAAAVVTLALGVRRGLLPVPTAVPLLAALVVADLARAGAGVNPQVQPTYFELLPATAGLLPRDGSRIFSYGVSRSPAFRAFLASSGPQASLAGLYLDRQLLGPYANVLDRTPSAEAADLAAFAPRAAELEPGLFDPARAGELVPWLRNASVTRVLSLDPLTAPGLRLLGEVPALAGGLAVHVYGLDGWPVASVACRVIAEPDGERARARVYEPGFDPERDVVLDGSARTSCTTGKVEAGPATPGRESFEVSADGDACLIVRASHGRGWTARVDGVQAAVRLADGKHRAVLFPPGRHRVELRYEPPGLRAGLWASALAVAVVLGLAVRAGRTA